MIGFRQETGGFLLRRFARPVIRSAVQSPARTCRQKNGSRSSKRLTTKAPAFPFRRDNNAGACFRVRERLVVL